MKKEYYKKTNRIKDILILGTIGGLYLTSNIFNVYLVNKINNTNSIESKLSEISTSEKIKFLWDFYTKDKE